MKALHALAGSLRPRQRKPPPPLRIPWEGTARHLRGAEEELARLGLKALELRPAGESAAQAQDRPTTVRSVGRQRVIREARAAEERAREIRAAMARHAARQAAAKYGRE